jgi:hypothetical protein
MIISSFIALSAILVHFSWVNMHKDVEKRLTYCVVTVHKSRS